MRQAAAGAVAGLAAGLAVSAAMTLGRRGGVLHKTLVEDAEDWLDRTVVSRRYVGEGGAVALEQANHFVAAAVFGLGYSLLRGRAPSLSPWMLGALYGGGLYVVNIAGIAPLIRLTEGEQNAPASVRAERLGLHLLYGVVTAAVAARLTSR